MSAASFDNQSCCSPNLESYCGTTWGQILQTEWDLGQLVDKRFTIMGHPDCPQICLEPPTSKISPAEVVICNHNQPANTSIDKSGKVEAWSDPAAICEIDNLRASKSKLEVAGKHFLNSLWMTKHMSWFCTAFTQERSEERRVGKECRSRWSPY